MKYDCPILICTVAVLSLSAEPPAVAQTQPASELVQTQTGAEPEKTTEVLRNPIPPSTLGLTPSSAKGNPYLDILRKQADRYGLPLLIADAVMHTESRYNPWVVGSSGEIGLMQIMPSTAAMLGFKGTLDELADTETNVALGVQYLAKAWELAGGDFCRTLVKYRSGHGEERETPLSTRYCARARAHIANGGTPPDQLGLQGGIRKEQGVTLAMQGMRQIAAKSPSRAVSRKRGPNFWAAHEARIRRLTLQVRSRWARIAMANSRSAGR